MKECEERPLGFNSVVWREVTLCGRPWWISLLTGKITSTQPPKQATGGILGEGFVDDWSKQYCMCGHGFLLSLS